MSMSTRPIENSGGAVDALAVQSGSFGVSPNKANATKIGNLEPPILTMHQKNSKAGISVEDKTPMQMEGITSKLSQEIQGIEKKFSEFIASFKKYLFESKKLNLTQGKLQVELYNSGPEELRPMIDPKLLDDSEGISKDQISFFQKFYSIDEKVAQKCLEKFREEGPDKPLILYAIEHSNAIHYDETWELSRGEILSMCSRTFGKLSRSLVDTSGLIKLLAGYSKRLADPREQKIIQNYFQKINIPEESPYKDVVQHLIDNGEISHDLLQKMNFMELRNFVYEMQFAVRSIEYEPTSQPTHNP